MLSKMIKYDLLFGVKSYGLLLLLLCGTGITGFVVSLIGNTYLNTIALGLNMLISVFLLGAYVMTGIRLFYNALSSDEAVLNYTIPVSTGKLILSKFAAIWIWGAAVLGALALTWVSLYFTLMKGMEVNIPSELKGVLIIALFQIIATWCVLAYSVSLCNTPKMKNSNTSLFAVTVIAYVLSQLVNVVQLGVLVLWLYIEDAKILSAILSETLTPEQETALLNAMSLPMNITSVILAVFFFWLTVRTADKKRSV